MFNHISNSELRGAFNRIALLIVFISIGLFAVTVFGGILIAKNQATITNLSEEFINLNEGTNGRLLDYGHTPIDFDDDLGLLREEVLSLLIQGNSQQLDLNTNTLNEPTAELKAEEENMVGTEETIGHVTEDQDVSEISCVPRAEVTELRYVLEDEVPPIPEKSVVEFVTVCDGSLAVRWIEKLAGGNIVHTYDFTGVDLSYIHFNDPGRSSSYDYVDPVSGDTGTLLYYEDWHNSVGNNGSDGVLDALTVMEDREWTEIESGLINLGNQFYNEAVEKNLFYFYYATDCPATEYRMNGKPIQPGPYGKMYKVPLGGGILEAFYESESCWYKRDTVRWSYEVNPGDAVVGTEQVFVFPMDDPDPWSFCNRLDRMRPVWQVQDLPYDLNGVCENLWELGDDGTLATLAREGFLRADTRYGDRHPDFWVPFVFYGGSRRVEHSWPDHEWERVESIDLGNDKFLVTMDIDASKPIFSYQEEGEALEENAYSNDIPWYGEWGSPLVFVTNENMDDYYFQWGDTVMYRVRRISMVDLIIEKAVWIND